MIHQSQIQDVLTICVFVCSVTTRASGRWYRSVTRTWTLIWQKCHGWESSPSFHPCQICAILSSNKCQEATRIAWNMPTKFHKSPESKWDYSGNSIKMQFQYWSELRKGAPKRRLSDSRITSNSRLTSWRNFFSSMTSVDENPHWSGFSSCRYGKQR